MDIFEAMSTCRAIRYLKPDPIDDDLIEKVITAATWAPSPGNSQGRDFVVVTDPDKKKRIGDAISAAMSDRVAAMERPDKTHRLMLDGTGQARILEHDQADTHGHIELLVGVEGDGVGFLDAPQQVLVGTGEQGGATPGSVHVEVGAEFAGYVSHAVKRVNVAGFGGACHAADGLDLDLLAMQFQAFIPVNLG